MPKTLATVDRLIHHAHLCATGCESVRLAQALSGQGVTPLTNPPEHSPKGPHRSTGGRRDL